MFSFANPWYLLLMPLAAGPLILHLLSRRKMRRTEFSSLFFLRKLRERRFRWLKLRDILLLILRTLFLAFIVLALSGPVWKGRFPIKVARADMVLIIDDSYSTAARFDEIKETAVRLSDELASGSQVALLTPSGQAWDTTWFALSPGTSMEWRNRLEGLIPSQSGRDLKAALESAKSLLQTSKAANRRIGIISDGQARAFDFMKSAPIPKDIEVFAFIDQKDAPDDAWIIGTELFPAFPLPDEAQSVKVQVGSFRKTQTILGVYADEKEFETRPISLGQEIKELAFNLPAGVEHLKVELSPDSIPADDRRFVLCSGRSRLRVALVAGVGSDLLELALRVGDGLEIERVSPSSAAMLSPESHDVIIWDAAYSASQISAASSQGLPVLVLLDNTAVDVQGVFNVIEESRGEGFEIMARSELFRDLAEQDRREIRFKRYVRLQPSGGRVIISLSGADPLLIADTSRAVFYVASRFSAEATDLVYRAIFPVLVQRLATFAAGERSRNEFNVGDTLRVRVPKGAPMFVETPELHYEITPKVVDQGFIIEFANTQEPGFYTIGSRTFVVNPDPREASTTRIGPRDLEERGIKVFPLGASTPIKLWLWALILAAICLAAEFLFIFL